MTELELKQLLSKITRPDETARTAAHAHWVSLAKPLGGLGRLETMLILYKFSLFNINAAIS